MLSPFEWWCRNFILTEICKPCLFFICFSICETYSTLSLFIGLHLNTYGYPVGNIGPVPLGIKLQQSGQRVDDVVGGKVPSQLEAVDSPGSLDLSAEGSGSAEACATAAGGHGA